MKPTDPAPRQPRRTFLVECYLPSLDRAAVSASADRATDVSRQLAADGPHLAYLGAMLVAKDEVVFHAFSADDAAIVDEACRRAAIPFERIVESESVPGDGLYSAEELLARIQAADGDAGR
ncbi:MAG: hypothetical protein HY263_07690 [Chloroflexi bacterium]|nr:hypothetical protein [Chloroflexota bacterium]